MATQPYGQQQYDQHKVRQQRELSNPELAEYANNCKILASVLQDNFARRILEDEVQRATQALVQGIEQENGGRGSQQYRNRDDQQQMRS